MLSPRQDSNPAGLVTVAKCMLLLRIAVAVFMLQWALGKVITPADSAHTIAVFYKLEIHPGFVPLLGVAQLIAIAAFVTGFRRWVSYGLIFLMNLAATLSTWKYITNPFGAFENLLFWNALPILIVSWVMFRLRNLDTLYSLDSLLARRVE